MHGLTYDQLRDAGAFHLLGRLYSSTPSIRMLLRELGADLSRLPTLDGQSPAEFWSAVCQGIDDGKFPFGLAELINRAWQDYPGNHELAGIAGAGNLALRVLCLLAAPSDMARMRLDIEHRTIDEITDERQTITAVVHPATRISDIIPKLLSTRPEIVHFSGHGTTDGQLVFEDDAGVATTVSSATLAEVFTSVGGVRCVVLNSCFSGAYADVLLESADSVIGSTAPLGDKAAIVFTKGFYTALAAGRGISDSYGIGLAEMRIQGHDTSTMRLLRREGVTA